VAALVSVLGYATTTEQMSARLERILQDEDYTTLVATDTASAANAADAADAANAARIVGFAGTRVGPMYESDGLYGQIIALAVAPDYQRRGIGRLLLEAAERALIEQGARKLILTSGNHRTGAHAFYEQHGYAFTGRRYLKTVGDPL
jgi:ribosomal protein S18 acetylase RimI-like enzyme